VNLVMELFVLRVSSGVEATLGILFDITDGIAFQCYTLEDQHQDIKVRGETRIPAGRYQIKLRTEGGMYRRYRKRFPWHQGMLWLQDVPGFEWIYLHVGNKDDDTLGCLLVGDGQISNVVEMGQVTNSVAAYRRLYERVLNALAGGKEVWISINDYA